MCNVVHFCISRIVLSYHSSLIITIVYINLKVFSSFKEKKEKNTNSGNWKNIFFGFRGIQKYTWLTFYFITMSADRDWTCRVRFQQILS